MATISNSRIILGLDFGSTFSGLSWAWSERSGADAIRPISSWQNVVEGTPEQVKVPTKIHYPSGEKSLSGNDSSDDSSSDDDFEPQFDPRTQITWGYGVPGRLDPIQWFKLLLLDEEDIETYISEEATAHLATVRQMIQDSGKDVLDVIADYLRLLWKHGIQQIISSVGRRRLDEIPFTVVATVPAIWKGYVRSRMRLAIKNAGILDARAAGSTILQFVSEPEAGALATLADLQSTCSVQKGDCLTIVDIGGGTGDLISYQVVDDQKFAVTEVVEGKGALCGAIFLDQAFTKLLKTEIGEDNWNRIPNDEIALFLDAQWERGLKRLYVRGRSYTFRLTATFVQVTGKTHIKIDKDKLLELFTSNRVITETMKLIREQIDGVKSETGKPPKYIAMVGGFGGSRFLKEEIEKAFGEESDVLQAPPDKTWSAISRGAVMSAAKGLLTGDFAEITARIARANYGFTYETNWVDGKFKEEDKHWSLVEHCYKAKNQILWFLKKGERSSQHEPFRIEYCRVYQPGDKYDYPNLVGEIHTYPNFSPPTRVQDGVTKACDIKFTAPVPFDDLPTETNHRGNTTKVFDYAYEILAYGDSIDVAIYASGERLAGKNLSIDHEIERRQGILRVEPRPPREVEKAASSRASSFHDVEAPPPSYTPFDNSVVDPFDDPFADPPGTSTAAVSPLSTGVPTIPALVPMPSMSPASPPGFQPLQQQNTAPSAMQSSSASRLAAPTAPAVSGPSSLTPVLAPTPTPLVSVLPAHTGPATTSSRNGLAFTGWSAPEKQANTSNNPYNPARHQQQALNTQRSQPSIGVTPPAPVPPFASAGNLAPVPESPLPSPTNTAATPSSRYNAVLSPRRSSITSVSTESSAATTSEGSDRSKKEEKQSKLRPLGISTWLHRK